MREKQCVRVDFTCVCLIIIQVNSECDSYSGRYHTLNWLLAATEVQLRVNRHMHSCAVFLSVCCCFVVVRFASVHFPSLVFIA